MAKKKLDVSESTEEDKIDQIYAEITKEFGQGVISTAHTFLDEKKVVIPVSPALDVALNGGIPEGSWVTLTGPPKIGKSSLALWIGYKAQQQEYGSRDIYYLSIEGRLKEMNISGLPLLNKDKFFPIRSTEGNILNAHQFLSIAEKIICTKPQSVVILDSVSALCTETEMNAGMDEQQRADGPKLLAKFCRKMANRIPINKTIVIAITQLSSNPSGYGSPVTEKSGYAIAYQVDVKLKAKKREYWESKTSKKPIGQIVDWLVETSALGAPGGVAQSYLRYGHGIDELTELISLGTDLGLISAAGAWYSCPFLSEYVTDYNEKDFKFQGQERLYEFFKGNPDKVQYLQQAFNKLVA